MRRDEAQHDVRERRLRGGHGGLAGVDAGRVPWKDPRLSFLAQVQHVVQSGRELQDRGRRGPAILSRHVMGVLRPRLLRQDGVCLAHMDDLHQHVQRAMVHAEGNRECRGLPYVALQLSLHQAAAAPPDLVNRQEPAGRLVDVHDAVCANAMGAHQPANAHRQMFSSLCLRSYANPFEMAFSDHARSSKITRHGCQEVPRRCKIPRRDRPDKVLNKSGA